MRGGTGVRPWWHTKEAALNGIRRKAEMHDHPRRGAELPRRGGRGPLACIAPAPLRLHGMGDAAPPAGLSPSEYLAFERVADLAANLLRVTRA